MNLDSTTLHEAAGKIGALPSGIKPIASGMRLEGPALTVSPARATALALVPEEVA